MTIKFSDITGGGIPYGDTDGRPANPGLGKLYSNGETARLELYTQASGWQNIVQETPGVSSITGNYSEAADSGTITIAGTNFVTGCYATAIGSNGVQVDAASTTFNSLVQVTAVFTGLSNAYEPYDIKVTNPSNLFGMLPDALYINASPVWSTSAGSLGTFTEQVSISVSATATDSDSTISYALASGSSLPSGISLDTSTGAITGTLPDVSSDTTYNFTINASDGLNVIPRSFSITSRMITPTVEYLVVAGGGGGAGRHAGAGGGGGMRYGSLSITQKSHTITVGNGGLGAINNDGSQICYNGENSVFSSITSIGGGRGGYNSGAVGSGGSGGGGNGNTGSNSTGGAGTSGQGNNGGNGGGSYAGGGGGGAGSAGSSQSGGTGGAGGNGLANSITGTSVVYAGGGGGGGWEGNPYGVGGSGGGGAGSGTNGTDNNSSKGAKGRNGTNGLGGGGGGGGIEPGYGGGDGGSGVVIIAYENTYPAITTIPGTLTYDQPTRSGYRVYRFTAGTGTVIF